MQRVGASTAGVGGHGQHLLDVGQGFSSTAQIGQDDDAVDQQRTAQKAVARALAARQALAGVAQRLFAVAQLGQLIGQVAVQHGIETVAAPRAGIAQGLVHVSDGLLGLAQRRVATGDGVEQCSALMVAQHAQALVAQRQQQVHRCPVLAAAQQRARQAHGGQDAASPVAQRVEPHTCALQLIGRLGQRAETLQVKAPHRARPGLGQGISRVQRQRQRPVGMADGAVGIHQQQGPGPCSQAQGRCGGCRGGRGSGRGGGRHADIIAAGRVPNLGRPRLKHLFTWRGTPVPPHLPALAALAALAAWACRGYRRVRIGARRRSTPLSTQPETAPWTPSTARLSGTN